MNTVYIYVQNKWQLRERIKFALFIVDFVKPAGSFFIKKYGKFTYTMYPNEKQFFNESMYRYGVIKLCKYVSLIYVVTIEFINIP